MADMQGGPAAAGNGQDTSNAQAPGGKPTAEITLCIYPGAKLALKVDDGDEVPVKDIDTAMMAVRRFASEELKGSPEGGMENESGAIPGEQEAEAAFQQGYSGSSGQ